jgi:hypothetical protein
MHDNRIGGEVVSVLASSVVDRGFEYRGRVIPKTIKLVSVTSPQHLRVRTKTWLALNPNSASEWSDMSTVVSAS